MPQKMLDFKRFIFESPFQIVEIDPQLLCPPESTGETQELLLQLLCVLLAFSSAAILAKLAYDYRQYRKRGQLPWIVLR